MNTKLYYIILYCIVLYFVLFDHIIHIHIYIVMPIFMFIYKILFTDPKSQFQASWFATHRRNSGIFPVAAATWIIRSAASRSKAPSKAERRTMASCEDRGPAKSGEMYNIDVFIIII